MFTAKIPANEHANVMASFWSMMMELEYHADQEGHALEKHMVQGYFNQWNRIMGDNKVPAWERRASKLTGQLLTEAKAKSAK